MAAPISMYTTRVSMEAAGIASSGWTSARVNDLIAQISSFVDGVCAQTFIPYEDTVLISGDERSILWRPDLLPILSVSDMHVTWNESNGRNRIFAGILSDISLPSRAQPYNSASWDNETAFTSSEFQLRPHGLPRYITLNRGVFPGGNNNISVTGVFGWPELSSIKSAAFSTTTTTEITTASTTVTLTTVTGLKVRDVMLIGTDKIPFIVQAINTSTKVVTFDAPDGIISASIASGATAVSYGAVPRGIQRACNFLAMREVVRQAQWASGNFVDPSLIASEKTDRYEYKTHTPASLIGFGLPAGMTGVAEIDQILVEYTPPTMIDFA